MKFKKVMLVTFLLLAILTIGAVSASEDADALAVDEIGGGDLDIAESSVDNASLEAEESGDSLEADNDVIVINDEISSGSDVVGQVKDLSKVYGTISVYANGTHVASKYCGGGYKTENILANKMIGSFSGTYNIKIVYHNMNDGADYTNEGLVTFNTPIENKGIPAEEFNFTLVSSEVAIGEDNKVLFSYQWPDGTDEWDSVGIDIKGDYERKFNKNSDTSKELTFGDILMFDPGNFEFTATYYDSQGYTTKLANGTFRVTKKFTANDFIEIYSKSITDLTDYVCNVYDSYGGLNGDVTILANGTSVYSKKFTGTPQSIRINGSTLPDTLKGEYDIKVTYKRAADGKEYSRLATITFGSSEPVVPDTRPYVYLKPTVNDISYGQDAVVKVTATEENGATYKAFTGNVLVQILYFNGISYVTAGEKTISLTNGVGSATFSNLNASDNYLVNLDANDTDAFKASPYSKSLKVSPIPIYVEGLENIELNYGDSINITVSAEGATGIYVELDGNPIEVNGFVIPISNLDLGEHFLEVTPITDSNHKGIGHPAEINVIKAASSINASDITIYGGQPTNVTVTTVGATGIEARIGEMTLPVDGNIISIPALSVGTHTLTITTVTDGNYAPVTRNVTITVKKLRSTVSVQNDNLVFDYNKSASTEVSFENATGFTAEVVGQPNAAVVSGNIVNISGLKPGSYELKVTTVVGEAYDPATATANITVNKLKSIVSIKDNLVFDYNQSATVDISYDADNVTAVVVDQPDAKVNVTGYKVTVSGLNAGNYVLVITPDVDAEIYDITAAKANITVNKLQTGISIKDDVIVFDYKGNASTTVLCDAKFVAEVVGQSGAAVVDGNVVTVSGLNPGDYTLKVTIDDANYEPATATANVTVNRIESGISVDNIAFTYGSSGSAVVSTEAGAIIAEVVGQPKANVVVSGKKVTVSGLAAGDYVLKVTTNDAAYEVSSATANITVKQVVTSVEALVWKTTTTYYTSGTIIVCLKDANGNPIQGKNVTVVIGKYSFNGVTNGKGRIYVNTPKKLTSGNYWPALSFAGDENYTASSGTAKLVVNKATPKFIYTKKVTYKRTSWNKKYTVALKTDLGYKMKNTYVVLKVNNVKYKGYTNYKGQITFNLKKLTKKGYYVGYLQYGGDKYCYNALKLKVKITVK